MDEKEKQEAYDGVIRRIGDLIAGENDPVAVMATVACELHQSLDYFDWTGFYRVVAPGLLKVGPYQGAHGCLAIPFERGVCGAAARLRQAPEEHKPTLNDSLRESTKSVNCERLPHLVNKSSVVRRILLALLPTRRVESN